MAEKNLAFENSENINNLAAGASESTSQASAINEKLSRAAEAITKADEENRLRLEATLTEKEETERQNAARLEESRLRREAAISQREEQRQKREAELLYAENYRKKLRAEKERKEALAAAKQTAQKTTSAQDTNIQDTAQPAQSQIEETVAQDAVKLDTHKVMTAESYLPLPEDNIRLQPTQSANDNDSADYKITCISSSEDVSVTNGESDAKESDGSMILNIEGVTFSEPICDPVRVFDAGSGDSYDSDISAIRIKIDEIQRKLSDTEISYHEKIAKLDGLNYAFEKSALEYELYQKEAYYKNELASLSSTIYELQKNASASSETAMPISYYPDTYSYGYNYEIQAPESTYANATAIEDYSRAVESREASAACTKELGETKPTALYSDADLETLQHFTRHDLKKHLSRSAKEEGQLIKKRSALTKRMTKTSGDRLARLFVEQLAISKTLIEKYISDYVTCATLPDLKNAKRYVKVLNSEIALYNADLQSYSALTGYAAKPLSDSLTASLSRGIYDYYIPDIPYCAALRESSYASAYNESYGYSKREDQMDQLRFLKKESERKVYDEFAQDEQTYIPPEDVFAQIKSDNDTVNARITYRTSKISDSIAVTKFKYGEKTSKEKKVTKAAINLLKQIKSDKKALIRATEKNNIRYLKIAKYDVEGITENSRADKRRLTLLRERVISLLAQRDEINAKLLSLYRENNKTGSASEKDIRKKYSEIRLKATKKAFKKQHRTYSKINRLKVTLKEKQKIYDVMNKRTELVAYLAECEYRMKIEKPKGSAKKALSAEIRSSKKNVRYAEKDIAVMVKKATRRSDKRPNPVAQLTWLLILVLLVGAGVALFVFKDQIFAWLQSLITSLKG
jgi:hypothetical protein